MTNIDDIITRHGLIIAQNTKKGKAGYEILPLPQIAYASLFMLS